MYINKPNYRTINGLKKALRQPNMSGEIVICLEKDKSVDLSTLSVFKNLRSLIILDDYILKSIPSSIFQLEQLEYLKIAHTSIKKIPEVLSSLTNLRYLILDDCPIKKLPESFSKLKQLQYLSITNTKLEEIPSSITQLQQLKKIVLEHNLLEQGPESFGPLIHLTHLYLGHNKLKRLSTDFSSLLNLQSLELSHNCLKELNHSFAQLKQLKWLDLQHNQLEHFPEALLSCSALFHIQLSNNLLQDLPHTIQQLTQLRYLFLDNNAFKSFPKALYNWFRFSEASVNEWGFSVDQQLYNKKKVYRLLANKRFQELSAKSQEICFVLFCADPQQISELPLAALLWGLNCTVPSIAENTLNYLLRSAKTGLKSGHELLVLGKTKRKRSALKQQLKAANIRYTTELTAQTSHVLISARGNKNLDKLPTKQHWQWLIESDVVNFLDKKQDKYLIKDADPSNIEQLEDLILSMKEENIALALELIQGGGMPLELTTAVFIAYKLSDDVQIRKKAKKLLSEKASLELLQALKNRSSIRINKNYISIKETEKIKLKLIELTIDSGLCIGKIAFAMAVKYQIMADYALDYAPEKYQRILLRDYLIQDGVFNMKYGEYLDKFPPLLLEFKHLKGIHINIKRWNRIRNKKTAAFVIPVEIACFKELELLNFSYNRIEVIPVEALAQLSKLKQLTMMLNKGVKIDSLKSKLPNCEFNTWYG